MAVDPGQLPRNYRHPPSSWLHRNPEVSAQGNAETSMDSQTESSDGTGTTPPPAAERWRPKANPWLIATVVSMAAFIEFLDTSIAHLALPYIAGDLAASNHQSTSLLTSYPPSNASYSWRWIFFINRPVGILALFLLYRLVEDPPWAKRAAAGIARFDYIGIGLLAVGIGALQVMLDKGQEDDWFGSRFIVTLFITTVVCLSSLVIWEWFHESPAVDIRLFKNFNFASSNLMIFVFGIVLFAALVMTPQYLQTVLGYTATLAGLVLSGGGALVLVAMPLVGQLTTRFQARHLIAFGWLLLALAMFYTTLD